MTHQHELLPLESVATTGENPAPDARDGEAPSESGVARAALAQPGQLEPTQAAYVPANQAFEQWKSIQGKFVDDPRGSVQEARALLDDLIQRIVQSLTEHKESLDRQWSSEPNASTEQLRLCLQHYRTLFTRLLPVVPTEPRAGAAPNG